MFFTTEKRAQRTNPCVDEPDSANKLDGHLQAKSLKWLAALCVCIYVCITLSMGGMCACVILGSSVERDMPSINPVEQASIDLVEQD